MVRPRPGPELKDTYGPALTKDGKYAFALQSKRNETQSADSFARVLWPFGGSFLDDEFRSNLLSPGESGRSEVPPGSDGSTCPTALWPMTMPRR